MKSITIIINLYTTVVLANSADDTLVIFFLFSPGVDFSYKLSPKCQIMFSGKNKKKINMSHAENFIKSANRLI